MRRLWTAAFVSSSVLAGTPALAQGLFPQPVPPPSGRRVTVSDGDLVVAENGARVRLVRRTDATVRAIFNREDRWLVLLLDTAGPGGRTADGGVDTTYTFNDVTGEWPLGDRWDGSAVVEDYAVLGETGGTGSHGVGLVTSSGLVQLLSRMAGDTFRDPAATVSLTYSGSSRGTGANQPFAAAEAQQIAAATRNLRSRSQAAGGVVGLINGQPVTGGSGSPPPQPPVRVGGTIRTPSKTVHVSPVMPAVAAQAGLHGVVVLEIVIGADGTITDAKVLRSLPPFDQAALDAVRQWRYEPTLLNGMPVPVIMTVTVSF